MSYANEELFRAVRDGNLEAVRGMVEAGADLSQVPEHEVIRSSRGYIFEINPAEMNETIHFRQGFNMETHSTARTEVVFTESLLDCAVMTGNAVLVRYLIERNCDAAKSRALYLATAAKDIEMIKILIAANAEPCRQVYNKFPQHKEAFWYEGVKLQSPLELAAETGQEEAAALYLSNKQRLTEENVSAAFMIAVSAGNKTILRSFLDCREYFAENVFSKATEKIISKAQPELSRLFLACGAEVDHFSRCLAYALRTADTEAVKMLAAQGIRPQDAAGWSSKYWEGGVGNSKFTDWGRIRTERHGPVEIYRHNKSESNFFDDDYKYISWTRSGGSDQFRGGVNNFSGYYGAAEQASAAKRIEMIHILVSEKLFDEEELSYLYYLAVVGDDIPFAEELERMGAAVTDFEPYAQKADRGKNVRSISDLATPAMSKEKAVFICRHLQKNEDLILGNNYFAPETDRTEMLLALLDYHRQVHIADSEKALAYFYAKDCLPGMEKMALMGTLTIKNTSSYIRQSAEDGKAELTAWLMDYRNKHFAQTEIDKETERDMWEL